MSILRYFLKNKNNSHESLLNKTVKVIESEYGNYKTAESKTSVSRYYKIPCGGNVFLSVRVSDHSATPSKTGANVNVICPFNGENECLVYLPKNKKLPIMMKPSEIVTFLHYYSLVKYAESFNDTNVVEEVKTVENTIQQDKPNTVTKVANAVTEVVKQMCHPAVNNVNTANKCQQENKKQENKKQVNENKKFAFQNRFLPKCSDTYTYSYRIQHWDEFYEKYVTVYWPWIKRLSAEQLESFKKVLQADYELYEIVNCINKTTAGANTLFTKNEDPIPYIINMSKQFLNELESSDVSEDIFETKGEVHIDEAFDNYEYRHSSFPTYREALSEYLPFVAELSGKPKDRFFKLSIIPGTSISDIVESIENAVAKFKETRPDYEKMTFLKIMTIALNLLTEAAQNAENASLDTSTDEQNKQHIVVEENEQQAPEEATANTENQEASRKLSEEEKKRSIEIGNRLNMAIRDISCIDKMTMKQKELVETVCQHVEVPYDEFIVRFNEAIKYGRNTNKLKKFTEKLISQYN